MNKKYAIECPECEENFKIVEPELGEIIVCAECALNLQITDIKDSRVYSVLSETDAEDWGE
ncbi:lysine biosynthesis protein LysW [Bacillus cereus]|uniref:lysine biosynthesis protein LysW n=1 Tax=Bacillus cereus TaxID=1396 RepID=UPI000BF349B2|nr:lysine biosynthesis protein LysW [Bacillus cereus]PER10580.1 lysine biosynthesis protein LysW [Bacillus cereus]PFI78831.1 lysine biosynthesis protein LysW [Bacillus cereus]PFO99856.1 lysine biosynthesis protein LysW [Bacillus cereus]